jgi:hypothetical protein
MPQIRKYRIYTGPTIVQGVANRLRANHFPVTIEGTESVWIRTSRNVSDVLETLNEQWSTWTARDIQEYK